MKKVVLTLVCVAAASIPFQAWGGQGHRLVGLIAANHLTPAAAANVAWLLEAQTLADVASWADRQVTDNQQTFYWHFLNIPRDAAGYDRDRDGLLQPGLKAGDRADVWRDCAVDRITYHEQRLADTTLDRADRAIALKFVVHLVGDLHQPFHALGVGRGGNDVRVSIFGVSDCGNDPAMPRPCNLHSVWDGRLITRRALADDAYVAALESLISTNQWLARDPGTPADWANESWALAKAALVAPGTNIDEAYYTAQIPIVDQRVALAGVRLAAVLNRALAVAAPH
jgi:hypothetical protein